MRKRNTSQANSFDDETIWDGTEDDVDFPLDDSDLESEAADDWDADGDDTLAPRSRSGQRGRQKAVSSLWLIPVVLTGLLFLLLLFLPVRAWLYGFFRNPIAGLQPQSSFETPSPIIRSTSIPVPTPTPTPTLLPVSNVETTLSGYAFDDPIYYVRSTLSPEEQAIYDMICSTIEAGKTQMKEILVRDIDQLTSAYHAVLSEHPEYFWLDGTWSYSYRDAGHSGFYATMTFGSTMTERERTDAQVKITPIAQEIIRRFEGLSDYEKALGVYEYLIDNTVYDLNYGAQSITDVLLNKRGVCAGYSKSTQYLLQQLGIQTLLISGLGRNDSHAWNIVRLDGNYYQLDTTWGDPTNRPNGGNDNNQRKTFKYFCVTDAEMFRDHTPEDPAALPRCTATACNYYIHEGRYTNYYDENWILTLLKQDIQAGQDPSFRVDLAVVQDFSSKLFIRNGK